MTVAKQFLNILVAPLILALAIGAVTFMVLNKKDPPSRKPTKAVPTVESIASSPADATPTIRTYGKVRTYFETQIASRVSGEILEISPSFQPGLAVSKKQLLIRIDPADYEAVVAERQSAVATNAQILAEEETLSLLAREDWISSGRSLEKASDFTLRKPQLAAATAKLAAATATLKKANLDLERTEIRAPFDAIVGTRATSPGNIVNIGADLGTLIGRDRLEVRLPLTPEQVALLDLPIAFTTDRDPPALDTTLSTPTRPGLTWSARITRTEAAIDTRNQVSWVIAEIDAPFAKAENWLPVGAFVNATLRGRTLRTVHELPASSLIEDAFVWVITPEKTLARQPVDRVFSEDDTFFARIPDPLTPLPLQVVTRPLASFQPGQTVQRAGEKKQSSANPAKQAPAPSEEPASH